MIPSRVADQINAWLAVLLVWIWIAGGVAIGGTLIRLIDWQALLSCQGRF